MARPALRHSRDSLSSGASAPSGRASVALEVRASLALALARDGVALRIDVDEAGEGVVIEGVAAEPGGPSGTLHIPITEDRPDTQASRILGTLRHRASLSWGPNDPAWSSAPAGSPAWCAIE